MEKQDLGQRLKPLLTSDGAMTEALANVVRKRNELSLGLAGMDLITEEGRFAALKQQGLVFGLSMALETILRPLLEMDDDAKSA